jgi:transposase
LTFPGTFRIFVAARIAVQPTEATMSEAKRQFLARQGLLHAKPERVIHPLFHTLDFFDPLDLPQVRYELLRAARVEHTPVVQACRLFGFSREYFYQLERDFMARGYVALLGAPRGRPPLLALNEQIIQFLLQRKLSDAKLTGEQLRQQLLATFQVDCSRRTVERLLEQLPLPKRGLRTS